MPNTFLYSWMFVISLVACTAACITSLILLDLLILVRHLLLSFFFPVRALLGVLFLLQVLVELILLAKDRPIREARLLRESLYDSLP